MLEASVYQELKLRELAHELRIISFQQHIHLYLEGVKICEYWPDFTCYDLKEKEFFWVEAKGMATPEWKIKLNLWKAGGPGVLKVYYGSWQKPLLGDVIYPKKKMAIVDEVQVMAKLTVPAEGE